MAITWLKNCLTLSLFMIYFNSTDGQLRADLQQGYELCSGRQLGHIVSVEVDGPGCYRRNKQAQWPCFLYPGRQGVYKVSFTLNQRRELSTIKSSIFALASYRGSLTFGRKQRVPFPGQVNKNACQAIGCPVKSGTVYVIEKRFTVPSAVRFLNQNMKVEFKLTTGRKKDTVICFIVPVLN